MALTKVQKQAQIQELRTAMQKAKSIVWMTYSGLSVADASDLRRRVRGKDAQVKVAKKTLYRIAAKDEGYPEVPGETMGGATAFIFSFADEISGAKVAFEFSKDHEHVKLAGGFLNGKALSAAEAIELAKMLGREEMLAKVLSLMQAPLVNFASVSSTPLRSFAIALKELSGKKNMAPAS